MGKTHSQKQDPDMDEIMRPPGGRGLELRSLREKVFQSTDPLPKIKMNFSPKLRHVSPHILQGVILHITYICYITCKLYITYICYITHNLMPAQVASQSPPPPVPSA